MDAIERRLREFRPVQPSERLRQRILAGAKSEWVIERERWGRTLRWTTAVAILTIFVATRSEYQTTARLAQIKWDVENSRREEAIVEGLANAIPENTDAALERYLASQAMAPPRPRGQMSNANLVQDLDAT